MNPDQALEILRTAAAEAQLKLADHIAVQKAVEVLRAALQPKAKGREPRQPAVPRPSSVNPPGL